MSKWKVISIDGRYMPVGPECDIENLRGGWRIIRRLVTHGVLCMMDSPCGKEFDSPAEAVDTIRAESDPSRCTCPVHWENHGPGYTEPMIVDPDFFCPAHYPENHRMRTLTAANGYTRKVREELQEFGSVPTWQQLPAAGKELWTAWAECEMWTEDLAQ